MKYFRYLLVLICTLFMGVVTANACTPADGCTNCQTGQWTACNAQKNASKPASCSKEDNCKGCSSGQYRSCYEKYFGSGSGNNNNNNNNNNGGYGYGGGGNINDNMSNEEICKICNSYDIDQNGTPNAYTKEKCIEAGCPIQENNDPGVINGEITDYDDYDGKKDNLTGCEKIFGKYSNGKFTDGSSLGYFLQLTFKIIKYAVPIILIVLTSVDFLKGIASSDKDIIKAATGKLAKRAIIAVAVFLVPTILNWILGLVTSYGTCGIK